LSNSRRPRQRRSPGATPRRTRPPDCACRRRARVSIYLARLQACIPKAAGKFVRLRKR
jgi:hypothetical protein